MELYSLYLVALKSQVRGDFFMDIYKLCEKVLTSEKVKDIPVEYVFIIINSVIEAISSGECFYDMEFE